LMGRRWALAWIVSTKTTPSKQRRRSIPRFFCLESLFRGTSGGRRKNHEVLGTPCGKEPTKFGKGRQKRAKELFLCPRPWVNSV
jgi:hypothetical protein